MPAIIVRTTGPHLTVIPFETFERARTEFAHFAEWVNNSRDLQTMTAIVSDTGSHMFWRSQIVAVSLENGVTPDWLIRQHSDVKAMEARIAARAQLAGQSELNKSLIPVTNGIMS